MIKTVFLVLSLILNQTAFAECIDVQEVKAGDKIVCDGVLLSPDAAKKIDTQQVDLKYYKDLSDKLLQRKDLTDKEVNVLDQRLKLYQDESSNLADKLSQRESTDKWERLMYFGLGVLATGLAVYGATQLR